MPNLSLVTLHRFGTIAQQCGNAELHIATGIPLHFNVAVTGVNVWNFSIVVLEDLPSGPTLG